MVDPTPLKRPVNWDRFRTDEAERIIRERAKVTAKIFFASHAFDRVEERTITQQDAYSILRNGYIDDSPQKNTDGEWEVTVVMRMPGTREAGVVTIVYRNEDYLFVKTVEWMDWTR